MKRTAESLLVEALRLTVEERLKLGAQLMASADGPSDPDWNASWLTELDRRTAEAHGKAETLPEWAEVRSRILERLARR